MCSVVYALDLYNCVYMYEVITVKKKKKKKPLYHYVTAFYRAKVSIGVYMLWITHDSSFVTQPVKKQTQ